MLEHRGTRRHLERHAHTVDFQQIGIFLENPVHIFNGMAVLHLVIHVKDHQFSVQVMFPNISKAQVQQHATVFPARKGDINVVEILENTLQPVLADLIHV